MLAENVFKHLLCMLLCFCSKMNSIMLLDLPDEILVKVIRILPLKNRVRMSDACGRLRRLAQESMPWPDVTIYNLSITPDINRFQQIFSACPNLTCIVSHNSPRLSQDFAAACFKTFGNRLSSLHVSNARGFALHQPLSLCPTLREIVWHNDEVENALIEASERFLVPKANCLTHLRISGEGFGLTYDELADGIRWLTHLEALILACCVSFNAFRRTLNVDELTEDFVHLESLKELTCAFRGFPKWISIVELCTALLDRHLAKLELLVFGNWMAINERHLQELVKRPRTLKLLVASGCMFKTERTAIFLKLPIGRQLRIINCIPKPELQSVLLQSEEDSNDNSQAPIQNIKRSFKFAASSALGMSSSWTLRQIAQLDEQEDFWDGRTLPRMLNQEQFSGSANRSSSDYSDSDLDQ